MGSVETAELQELGVWPLCPVATVQPELLKASLKCG